MALITTTSELADVCRRLAAHDFVTVDTEFLRENTFWPKVCVIQLASPQEAVAIDALAVEIDLTPFLDLMANANVVKVFHAARQDIEIIWRLSGRTPSPLFDTQVAASVCGYGDQVSYGELVHDLCKAQIDKSSRFTDWSARPLSAAQITYAIADVTYLRDIYEALLKKLHSSNREHWLREEMAALSDLATYEQNPDNAWKRLRNRARKARDLAILIELAAWRETEAQKRDVPRARVLKDDVLSEIALAAPKTPEALATLRAVPRGLERSHSGQEILAAVARGLERDPDTLPALNIDRRNHSGGATVELLKVLLRQICETHEVAAKMIATTEDLEALAASDQAKIPALEGWRYEIFGKKALELKHGRLALTLEHGKVQTLEWQDAN